MSTTAAAATTATNNSLITNPFNPFISSTESSSFSASSSSNWNDSAVARERFQTLPQSSSNPRIRRPIKWTFPPHREDEQLPDTSLDAEGENEGIVYLIVVLFNNQ
jgi:hypothetical protein